MFNLVAKLSHAYKALLSVILSRQATVIYALLLAALVSNASLAAGIDCYDPNTFITYSSANGNYWFIYVDTQCAPGPGSCPYLYDTEGGKGNISKDGSSYIFNTQPGPNGQNVNEWLMSAENVSDNHQCLGGGTSSCCLVLGLTQCTIQVGWHAGYSAGPTMLSCSSISSGQTDVVYVEIFDDSATPCVRTSFGTAPPNASYDARYYSTLGNGLHRYNVYYEVPGSNNIQVLAYGDYVDLKTAEIAASEIYSPLDSSSNPQDCPYLAVPYSTTSTHWDYHGLPASQNTFADHMYLYYNGSWQLWTNNVNGVTTYLYAQDSPYHIAHISDWSEWKSAGPT